MFILEDFDCRKIVTDDEKTALRIAVEWLNDSYDKEGEQYATFERKCADYQELMETYLNKDYRGFSIEEFCYCYPIEYVSDKD